MTDKHIILAPQNNYYNWIKSIRLYLLTFDPKLTNDPEKTAGYDVVTIINPPGAYLQEPDILSWLQKNYPDVVVDNIPIQSQDELAQIMHARVLANQRYGEKTIELNESSDDSDVVVKEVSPEDKFRLQWPTEYPIVVQPFGENAEMYVRWGQPGHEGVDIRAISGSRIFAGAAGKVYRIERDPDSSAYGKQIRIYHPEGFRTVYAHLDQILVVVGQEVEKGEVIASAGNSGSAAGSYIHFSLKRDFASENKLTHFSGDFIDPMPFLEFPQKERLFKNEDLLEQKRINFGWNKPCLVGLNLQESGKLDDPDLQVINSGRIEAVKLPSLASGETIERLLINKPDIFVMSQLVLPDSRSFYSTSEWLELALPFAQMMYSRNIRYFEVHKLPNLNEFGYGKYWQSGKDFSMWWKTVVEKLREKLPDAKFGFPALSPGGQVNGFRADAKVFLEQADDVIQLADWIGLNSYWSNKEEFNHPEKGINYQQLRKYYPEKLLFVTGFGNIDPYADAKQKGAQYASYYQKLRRTPGIGAAFADIVYSDKGWNGLHWRDKAGKVNEIPLEVGKRGF